MVQVSDLVAVLAWDFDPLVGAWCLSLAGPAVARPEVFFSSDYLSATSPFLCVIIVC